MLKSKRILAILQDKIKEKQMEHKKNKKKDDGKCKGVKNSIKELVN